jgi:single-strand DNA-binding protein
MNIVYIVGRSGADAEVKHVGPTNFPVCSISVATSKKVKDVWQSTWHRVVLLGRLAESVAPQIKKGSKVFIVGEIQVKEWTDKTGNKRTSTEILAQEANVIEKPRTTEQFPQPIDEMTHMNTDSDLPF